MLYFVVLASGACEDHCYNNSQILVTWGYHFSIDTNGDTNKSEVYLNPDVLFGIRGNSFMSLYRFDRVNLQMQFLSKMPFAFGSNIE